MSAGTSSATVRHWRLCLKKMGTLSILATLTFKTCNWEISTIQWEREMCSKISTEGNIMLLLVYFWSDKFCSGSYSPPSFPSSAEQPGWDLWKVWGSKLLCRWLPPSQSHVETRQRYCLLQFNTRALFAMHHIQCNYRHMLHLWCLVSSSF